jgi:hypothetical protein
VSGHRSDDVHRRWCPECDAQSKRPNWLLVLLLALVCWGLLIGLVVLVLRLVATLAGWVS